MLAGESEMVGELLDPMVSVTGMLTGELLAPELETDRNRGGVGPVRQAAEALELEVQRLRSRAACNPHIQPARGATAVGGRGRRDRQRVVARVGNSDGLISRIVGAVL